MQVLIFILYFVACAYAIAHSGFLLRSGIKRTVLVCLFAVHVAVGALHNWIAYHYFPNHGDVWQFFADGVTARNYLFHNWSQFQHVYLPHAASGSWKDISFALTNFQFLILDDTNALLAILSFNNFYISTMLFSFFAFWGHIAFFRFYKKMYPDALLASWTTLLIPSVIFWTAVIHKEGMLYALLGFFFYYAYRAFEHKANWRAIFATTTAFCFAMFLRSQLALLLIPTVWIWFCISRLNFAKRKKLMAAFLLVLIAFIILLIMPDGLISWLSGRQQEYMALTANSAIYLPPLQPHIASMIHVFPYALKNGLFEPLPGMGGNGLYLFFALELLLIWLVAVWSLARGDHKLFHGFDYASHFIAITLMLIIGFTAPFVGAIVRYRSLILPFLLAPSIHMLQNHKYVGGINSFIQKNLMRNR